MEEKCFYQNIQSAMCNGKKSKFLKEQEARGLLNRLGIRTRNKNTCTSNSFVR